MQLYINYALMVQFGVLAVTWFLSGDRPQGIYWLGAFVCTLGVTIK